MTAGRRVAACASASVVVVAAAAVSGQTLRVERARTLVVGAPAAGARTDRVDGARTGETPARLPASNLTTEWRTPLGTLVERPPVVDERGTTYVVGTRGEVIAIARDGAERWRATTGAVQPGPAALLSDGTLVFVDAAGAAVAVRRGAIAWRHKFGRPDAARPAPLPLLDGGVLVATTQDLAILDADGLERSRTTLPEPTFLPPVAALGKVIAVTASGAVWAWSLGADPPARVGSFGGPVDGAAALADEHTLVGLVGLVGPVGAAAGQTHLASVDLLLGASRTLAVAPAGQWVGPPAMRGSTAYLVLLTPTSELAVSLDASGNETSRTLLAMHALTAPADAGATAPVRPPQTPPLVDAAGDLAFATAEGTIGVARGETVELLSDVCDPPPGTTAHAAPPVVGLAPLEAGAMVAVCHAGAVLAIHEAPR